MGSYNTAVITTAGQALLTSILANQGTLTFSKFQTSSYQYASGTDLSALTSLNSVEQEVTPSGAGIIDSTTLYATSTVSNSGLAAEYTAYTLGLFISDGVDEVLFAVATAIIPDVIPEDIGGTPSTYTYSLQLGVSSTEDIMINVDMDAYLTADSVIDNLTSTSVNSPLSANQGKVLNDNKAERTDISGIITTGTKNTTGSQIASGTYFYLNGKLVKAKSLIDINDDYTLNTNYEVATVGGVLAELNSNLNESWSAHNRIFEGRDLTVIFASEIANYTDEWAWIQARLNNHNITGLRVGDFIPINVAANGGIDAETHKSEIAGINPYRRTGNSGHEVGYHIDWITRDCYSGTVQFNTTNINNGNATNNNPFLASNLKSWLDGTLYPLLETKVKNVIKTKRILAPSRYQSGATLTDDNSYGWQNFDKLWVPLEGEIFDSLVWSTKGFGNGQAVQYPIFANSYEHRIKGAGPGGARAYWWTASALSGHSTSVVTVHAYGHSDYYYASGAFYVPVCFRTMEDTE